MSNDELETVDSRQSMSPLRLLIWRSAEKMIKLIIVGSNKADNADC